MPGSIPWSVAQEVCEAQDCRQVIICAWDGQRSHVLTYGRSVDDSDQAAQGGNFVKKALGWDERLCLDESPRVTKLRDALAELLAAVQLDRKSEGERLLNAIRRGNQILNELAIEPSPAGSSS